MARYARLPPRLDAIEMLVPEFIAEPNGSADKRLRIGVNLAQHELFPNAADIFERCVRDYAGLFEGYYNLALTEFALRKCAAVVATI